MLLKGNKIYLRALEPEDLEFLYRWENDGSIWLSSGTQAPFSKHVLKEYINQTHDIYLNRQLRLMITEVSTGRPVGCIDLFEFDPKNRRAGVGILIGDKEDRSKGFASEALTKLIEYSFSALNLHQLYCHIQVSNLASVELFRKHGFIIVGTKKDWVLERNVFTNVYFLQLIREDEI